MNEITGLKSCALFHNLAADEIYRVLSCFSPRRAAYKKDDTVMSSGDAVENIAIVLSGSVLISKEDADGSRVILAVAGAYEMFAEAIVCAGAKISPVSVICDSDCEILFLPYAKITKPCTMTCLFHAKIIENLMRVLAQKNMLLNKRIDLLTKRTLREKLAYYLQSEAAAHNSRSFTMSITREELADFICANRSAMTRELSSMQDEGLISFNKNNFDLLKL